MIGCRCVSGQNRGHDYLRTIIFRGCNREGERIIRYPVPAAQVLDYAWFYTLLIIRIGVSHVSACGRNCSGTCFGIQVCLGTACNGCVRVARRQICFNDCVSSVLRQILNLEGLASLQCYREGSSAGYCLCPCFGIIRCGLNCRIALLECNPRRCSQRHRECEFVGCDSRSRYILCELQIAYILVVHKARSRRCDAFACLFNSYVCFASCRIDRDAVRFLIIRQIFCYGVQTCGQSINLNYSCCVFFRLSTVNAVAGRRTIHKGNGYRLCCLRQHVFTTLDCERIRSVHQIRCRSRSVYCYLLLYLQRSGVAGVGNRFSIKCVFTLQGLTGFFVYIRWIGRSVIVKFSFLYSILDFVYMRGPSGYFVSA